jgi:hypothetical protein
MSDRPIEGAVGVALNGPGPVDIRAEELARIDLTHVQGRAASDVAKIAVGTVGGYLICFWGIV